MNARQEGLFDLRTAIDPWRAAPVVSTLARSALLLFLAGASLALAISLLLLEDLNYYSLHNVLPHREADLIVVRCCVAGGLFVLLPGLYLAFNRTRAAVAHIQRFSSVLVPLTLSFPVPLFTRPSLWTGEELLFSASVVLWGLAVERALRICIKAWPETSLMNDLRLLWPRLVVWTPRIVVALLVAGFITYMTYYTILRHLRLESRAYDLGLYDNMMWNLLRGEWFSAGPVLGMRGSHIQYHATFTAYLLAPIYAVWQGPETLLVIQAALCGLAALPLYGLVRNRLRSRWMAVAFVAAYLLYAPLHGPIFYDFHFLTLAPFFVLTTLYFFETKSKVWLFVTLALALLTREDVAIGVACVFLFYLISGERPWAAIVGGVIAADYLFFVKFWVLPAHSFSLGEDFLYVYKELIPEDRAGFPGIVRTMFTNPYYLGERVLTEGKLGYFLAILGPVLLLPLRHGRTWILLIPGTLLVLFSTGYDPVTSTAFQYTNHWIPYVFVGGAIAVSTWRGEPGGRVRMGAAVGAMLLVSIIMSHNFGAFVRNNSFRGGFGRVSFDFTEADEQELSDLRALTAQIPSDASVTASEVEVPHVSSRRDCFTLRNGHNGSDFVLTRISEGRGSKISKKTMTTVIQSGEYGIVETRGSFQLWQKGADQSGNVAAARVLTISPGKQGKSRRSTGRGGPHVRRGPTPAVVPPPRPGPEKPAEPKQP